MVKVILSESYPLQEAAKRIPPSASGKPVSPATLIRWALYGVRGIKLPTLKVGSHRYTSDKALQAFFEAIADPNSIPTQQTARKRSRREDAIEAELDAVLAGSAA